MLVNILDADGLLDRERNTERLLATEAGHPAGADFVETTLGVAAAAVDLRIALLRVLLFVAKEADEGSHKLGRECLDHLLGHDGGGEAGAGVGGDGADDDVVLGALGGKGEREAEDTGLGGRVVGLAKVTVETDGGGGVDDATVLLLDHVVVGGLGDLVGAADVDLLDDVPVVVGQALEGFVTEDTARVIKLCFVVGLFLCLTQRC